MPNRSICMNLLSGLGVIPLLEDFVIPELKVYFANTRMLLVQKKSATSDVVYFTFHKISGPESSFRLQVLDLNGW